MQVTGHAPPRLALAVLLAALCGLLAGPAHADESFTFSGHGYGHGVGMPQYGAEGYALAGGSYQQILALYYPGTALGATPPNAPIRVLLQSGQPRVQVSSSGGLVAHDEKSGAEVSVPAAAVVTQSGGTYTVASADGVPLAAGWAGPVLLRPASTTPLTLAGTALYGGANRVYRGAIRVVQGSTGLAAVNVLPLEDYLRGVVPSEVPSTWKPAALEAQAVAARGYALATAATPSGLFDEYADTRSQAYAGMLAEKPETDAAIAATSGQILTYAGKTAVTYFSSSSGGRTANVQEVFTNAQPTPYLVAVDDPYDAASPYHDWTLSLAGSRIAQALGYAGTRHARSRSTRSPRDACARSCSTAARDRRSCPPAPRARRSACARPGSRRARAPLRRRRRSRRRRWRSRGPGCAARACCCRAPRPPRPCSCRARTARAGGRSRPSPRRPTARCASRAGSARPRSTASTRA